MKTLFSLVGCAVLAYAIFEAGYNFGYEKRRKEFTNLMEDLKEYIDENYEEDHHQKMY